MRVLSNLEVAEGEGEGGEAEATVTDVGGPRGERRGSRKHPGEQ